MDSSSPEQLKEPQAPAGYLVRHNDKIIGIFEDEFEAVDAKNGYSLQNDIEIDDTLDVLQLI